MRAISNNNNNYKTSTRPISSKRIKFSGEPSSEFWQSYSPSTMQSSSTYDQME